MEIIIQISAWVFLAVGFFALGQKFFPNFKKWCSAGTINYFWLFIIIFGVFIFLTYPYFFNLWAIYFWHIPESELTDYTKLGPLGDIYGSLNTLFTSATLLIVIYSTLLQRQANKDAREAMMKQLKQAKKSTKKQLRQAEKSTKKQLRQAKKVAEEQLTQARNSMDEQLDLARSTHAAQLKETVYSNFLNTYNSLMNYKLAKYNSLEIMVNNRIWRAEEIFKEVSLTFLGQQAMFDLKLTQEQIGDLYNKTLINIAGANKGLAELNSYFIIYDCLFDLIKRSTISDEEKLFFRKSISNTMSTHEQLTLLWAATSKLACNELIKNTGIFNQFYGENLMPFLVTFFEKSSFSHPDILSNWDRFSK